MSKPRLEDAGDVWVLHSKKLDRTPSQFWLEIGRLLPILAAMIVSLMVALIPQSLPSEGRLALAVFLIATTLWATNIINASYVALGSATVLVISKALSPASFFESLSSDVVWLMIGAFILGEAVVSSGLAHRITNFVLGQNRSTTQTFLRITTFLIPLTMLIPSTSGRAAVVVPLYHRLRAAGAQEQMIRAVTLLFPAVILVSTIGALTGAGSHLIVNDLLLQATGVRISFLRWMIYGLPFAIAAAYVTCYAILIMFIGNQRDAVWSQSVEKESRTAFSHSEIKTMVVFLLLVTSWMTETLHHIPIAISSICGALALTAPGVGVISWKKGLKSVSWNLVIFVGAALVLGRALIETGVAQWIIGGAVELLAAGTEGSSLMLLLALSFICFTSHLYMTSHSARAVALVPPIIYAAISMGFNPVAVAFISTVGMNYCLTMPVSSKALLLFQELGGEYFRPTDLLRLSAVLLLLHVGLVVIFYYTYWRWIGLQL